MLYLLLCLYCRISVENDLSKSTIFERELPLLNHHFGLYCRILVEKDLSNSIIFEREHHLETTSAFNKVVDPRNTSEYASHFHDELELSLHKALDTYSTPALALVSVLGNLLMFVVFSVKYCKTNFTVTLHQILALADGMSIVIRVEYHTLPSTLISCKMIMFCHIGV